MANKLIIILIALLVIVALGIAAYYIVRAARSASAPPTPPSPTPGQPPGPSPAPTPPAPTPPPNRGIGLWERDPGSGYADGKTYEDSVAYCASNNAILATEGNFMAAGLRGFEACICGWYRGPDGPEAGYYMQTTQPGGGCGSAGANPCPVTNDPKYGSFCYGPIPTSSDVAAYIVS